METIISANDTILAMVNNSEIEINEKMSEEAYWKWIQGVLKDGIENEKNRLQEI